MESSFGAGTALLPTWVLQEQKNVSASRVPWWREEQQHQHSSLKCLGKGCEGRIPSSTPLLLMFSLKPLSGALEGWKCFLIPEAFLLEELSIPGAAFRNGEMSSFLVPYSWAKKESTSTKGALPKHTPTFYYLTEMYLTAALSDYCKLSDYCRNCPSLPKFVELRSIKSRGH